MDQCDSGTMEQTKYLVGNQAGATYRLEQAMMQQTGKKSRTISKNEKTPTSSFLPILYDEYKNLPSITPYMI